MNVSLSKPGALPFPAGPPRDPRVELLAAHGDVSHCWSAYRALRDQSTRLRVQGRARAAEARTRDAVEVLRVIHEVAGASPYLYNALAGRLRALGDSAAAWAACRASLEMDGSPVSNPAGWTVHGALLREAGALGDSFETLETVRHRHPRDGFILRAIICTCAALAYADDDPQYRSLALHYLRLLGELKQPETDPLDELRSLVRNATTGHEREMLSDLLAWVDDSLASGIESCTVDAARERDACQAY